MSYATVQENVSHAEFLPGPKGYEVELDSLKLEYKRALGIGISDVEHNLNRRIFTVTVK